MEHAPLWVQTPRTELMKLLDSLAERRVMYMHAPAGYGKTVSALLWVKHRESQIGAKWGWIALDEFDNKTTEFCERFVSALLTLAPDNTELHELRGHPAFDTAPIEFAVRALSVFAGNGSKNGQNYYMVFDDLHIIEAPEILKLLPILIKRLPENLTPLFLSRSLPPDSFSEMVVKGELAMADAENLQFSSEEIKTFFSDNGHYLTNKQADSVYASTGGWVIGLRALLLSGKMEYNVKLTAGYLETFIKTHVWEKWDEQTRCFMKLTSVVDELTADLCEALIGEKNVVKTLEKLTRENAFLRTEGDGIYRFHDLFRDFLLKALEAEGDEAYKEQLKKAGDWFINHQDYYKAVEYYMKCGDKSGITKGLRFMYDYNSPYAAIEDTLAIIRLSVDGSIVDEYPFLLEVRAWAAFVEGHGEQMEGYLDRYFKKLPKIILQNPASAQTALLLRCMDYRESMIDLTNSLKKLPLRLFAKATTPSVSQNMPFFHRSNRDYSEYAHDTENNLLRLKETIGVLIGEEYYCIEDSLRSGFAYERGNMNAAREYALAANAKISAGYSPEIKFCAMMILAAVHFAEGQATNAHKALDNIDEMIEKDKALYLNVNLRAYLFRRRLTDGDKNAAAEWLKDYSESPYNHLSFYKIYRHFTTARAYIVAGDYNTAVLFLKKLLHLSERYRRTLDIIESCILLSIAYWKKGGSNQTVALELLERAIITAHRYGYTQCFTNEGAELVNMLHRMQKRTIQKEYTGEASNAFIKSLYILAVTEAKRSKGLTGGRTSEALTFTDKQKTVMRLLCEGCSRKEIAERMGLKPYGVKSHTELIYKKLDVPGSIEAVMKIRELKLLDNE